MLIEKPLCMTIQADSRARCKALLKVISMHEPVLGSDFDKLIRLGVSPSLGVYFGLGRTSPGFECPSTSTCGLALFILNFTQNPFLIAAIVCSRYFIIAF